MKVFRGGRTYLRFGNQGERSFGFKDACSRLVELSETMTVPAGYKIKEEGKDEAITGTAASANSSLHQTGNVINFSSKISLNKRVYEAEDWQTFRDAVANQTRFDKPMILISGVQ